MSRKESMVRKDSYVRFAVLGGPIWDSYRSHTGKVEHFYATKVACEKPEVLEGCKVPITDCRLIFARPVEVAIEVDYVSAPIQTPVKPIHGRIAKPVSNGKLLPGCGDDLSMRFFTVGAGVMLVYYVDTFTGKLVFRSKNDQGHLRMLVRDGWVNILNWADNGSLYEDTQNEWYHEVAHFARLRDPNMDLSHIRTTRELMEYVELNFNPADYDTDIDTAIAADAPIIWL